MNFGGIPTLGSFGATNANVSTAAASNSSLRGLMNRATNAFKRTESLLLLGLALVLILFVVLVIYNKTVGEKIQAGWDTVKKYLQEKGIISVELDPGKTGTPLIQAELTPEPTVILPPLTASLLPEPVTVPKPADVPPTDTMNIPTTDRPSGMPGASTTPTPPPPTSDEKASSKKDSKHAIIDTDEVFNISANIYTFNDAAAVCAAVGAELANYDQVKAAYDGGADWCNYGWIKGQMAVYPTQKSTWQKLQKGAPEFRNACGLPGINGGYFDNPELRFGVNCYGKKPAQKFSDELLDSQVALPKSTAELEFDKKVQQFRDQMDAVAVLPFQKGQWNE